MAETTAARTHPRSSLHALLDLALWALLAALGLLVATQLVFFAIHAAHLLRYPYPLDYGEGPLLAQVSLLRAGTPIWRLYANPDLPPYAVVNYPPIYHLLASIVVLPLGNALLAGRLVSLAATLGALAALWALSGGGRRTTTGDWPRGRAGERASGRNTVAPSPHRPVAPSPPIAVGRTLIVLAFLAIPIVREWSVVMRVDMLGVCLGLWGLAVVQRRAGRRALLWAAIPLALSLLVKPSLIAAPAAALLWLLFRDWRRALLLGLLLAAGSGAVAGLLQAGSDGWFALHVLSANANAWDRRLAADFWHDQLVILWPLLAAGALGALAQLVRGAGRAARGEGQAPSQLPLAAHLLPVYYTLFGAIVAFGVGKVGAYTNYFLEFYAGLIWLAASYFRFQILDFGSSEHIQNPKSKIQNVLGAVIVAGLVSGALLRYYPTWSETYLKLAGIIEGTNPPRLVAGRYGVWQDLRREREILATLAGVNAALVDEVRAAGAPIFTDVPGVAVQAGQLARIQVFEHRQLLDTGRWDQRALLRELANGRLPLVVLDYLGNWLTPEMIALITHRYAQGGSRGTYDLYQPVDPGPGVAADLAFPDGLRLVGYHLAPSPGRPAYHGGETALLTLDWQSVRPEPQAPGPEKRDLAVAVLVMDEQGTVLFETARPLLYGALRPGDWGEAVVQHMQPIALPPELPPETYRIAVTLRSGDRELAPPRELAPLAVEAPAGRSVGEQGYFVPAPLLETWERLGGDAGPGDALMPAVPFQDGTLQCFARACLRLASGQARQLPLGELVRLADVGLRPIDAAGAPDRMSDVFLEFWQTHGRADVLGPPITPELVRGDRIVQYTRYARLERPVDGGSVRLGRLGEEFLRLLGGMPYRWP